MPRLDDKAWVYAVPMINEDGEQRVVVVELAPHERLDALYHLAIGHPVGGDSGPIVNAHAANRALAKVGPGRELDLKESITRIEAQNVRTLH